MAIGELDVVQLKDGREATVLEVFEDGQSFLVETAPKPYEESEILDLSQDDIRKVIYKETK